MVRDFCRLKISNIVRFIYHYAGRLCVKGEEAGHRARSDCELRETEHLSRADRMAHKGPEFAGGLQADPRFDVEIIHWRSIKSRARGRERRARKYRERENREGKRRERKQRERERDGEQCLKPS